MTRYIRNKYDPEVHYIIVGAENIARACGVTRRTIYNWQKKYGFPISRMPTGHLATTGGLIDAWMLARRDAQPPIQKKGRSFSKPTVGVECPGDH